MLLNAIIAFRDSYPSPPLSMKMKAVGVTGKEVGIGVVPIEGNANLALNIMNLAVSFFPLTALSQNS